MILFFHFICILARYIAKNISKAVKDKICENENPNVCFGLQISDVQKTLGHSRSPVYENGTLRFFPPVFIQRYETIAIILKEAAKKWRIRKVVDFGCSELGFLMYLKSIDGITEILEVDIDEEVLERSLYKAAPLTSDFLMGKRKTPLDVFVLSGSVGYFDDHLIGCDAVICIELIEHLSENDFERMPYNIFYKIRPKIAVFTTPNADFNSLFPNFSGLRHKDHMFEWTRKEFQNWAQKILSIYPDYSVKFFGIGAGPKGSENLGCCTQVAVFTRNEEYEYFLTARDESEDVFTYSLLKHYKYPLHVDNRSVEQKILHEIQYQATNLSSLETYYSYETSECLIPISTLKEFLSDLSDLPSDEELVTILKNNGMDVRMKNDTLYLVWTEEEYAPSESSSKSDKEISGSFNDKDELFQKRALIWDNESISPEIVLHQSSWSKELQTGSKKLLKGCSSISEYNSNSNCHDTKSEEIKRIDMIKSRIPLIKNKRYESLDRLIQDSNLSFIFKPYEKISRSLSLDSCLENINCIPFERESYFLSLMPGGSSEFFSTGEKKNVRNCSGSSLISSSLDRAGDSGYPYSLPNDNLTPEQVDELMTENEMSRSTSASSEANEIDFVNHRQLHEVYMEDIPVENGDLANNNRDWEGNNVEGLVGQRLINEVEVERDPNDNLFFPEIEDFPPWLLNLGGLAVPPIYLPLHDSDTDEGMGDDTSSGFDHSLDVEGDIDLPWFN